MIYKDWCSHISLGTIIIGIIVLFFLFFIVISKKNKTRTGEQEQEQRKNKIIQKALTIIQNDGMKIITRANGQIMGWTNNGSKRYLDEKYDQYRRRINYINLDGEEDIIPADAMSDSRGKVKIIPIEHDGGVAVTEIKEKTENKINRSPIYTSRQANKIREKETELETMKTEMRNLSKEYKKKDRNYQDLQLKINDLMEERKEISETKENLRTANERLLKENESHKARIQALEAKVRLFRKELKELADSDVEIMGKAQEIIEGKEEMDMAELEAGKSGIGLGLEASPPEQGGEESEKQEEEVEASE